MPKNKIKVKVPQPYTQQERETKINRIKMQLANINMYHILLPEHFKAIDEFVKNGTEYTTLYNLPEYSRVLEIKLVNNKKEQTYINLKFNKIMVEGGENHPLNKLNKIQQSLLDDLPDM